MFNFSPLWKPFTFSIPLLNLNWPLAFHHFFMFWHTSCFSSSILPYCSCIPYILHLPIVSHSYHTSKPFFWSNLYFFSLVLTLSSINFILLIYWNISFPLFGIFLYSSLRPNSSSQIVVLIDKCILVVTWDFYLHGSLSVIH